MPKKKADKTSEIIIKHRHEANWQLAPAAKIISVILRNALEGRATDVHIEPGLTETRVRYRVDGVLHTSLTLAPTEHSALIARLKKLVGLPPTLELKPYSANFKLEWQEQVFNILAYFLPIAEGEKVVLHIIEAYDQPKTLTELGFLDYQLTKLESNLAQSGLFLVTGPIDAGKTTTLYTLLNILNQEEINITTLEDPIERYLSGINQLALADVSLLESLRYAIKQEPDVLMIDSSLTGEAAEVALTTAANNKKVFLSLPTKNTVASLKRLQEMGLPPFLLADNLRLIISQRLVKKVCDDCKVETAVPAGFKQAVKEILTSMPEGFIDAANLVFYRGAGCPSCGHTGYRGRLTMAEVLEPNDTLRQKLLARQEIKAGLAKEFDPSFISLAADGIIKVSKGLTTLEEVFKVIS